MRKKKVFSNIAAFEKLRYAGKKNSIIRWYFTIMFLE